MAFDAAAGVSQGGGSGRRAGDGNGDGRMYGFMPDGRPRPPTSPYPLMHEARSGQPQNVDIKEVMKGPRPPSSVPMSAKFARPLTGKARPSIAKVRSPSAVGDEEMEGEEVEGEGEGEGGEEEEEEGEEGEGEEEEDVFDEKPAIGKAEEKVKAKKRRRVVVACDTCRRKKVKCQGLPNAANTCNNCDNMGYTCSFTVEPDRSRGRYEIVESQRDTLLMALRSVAPDLAAQYERGELNIATPSGTLGRGKAAAASTRDGAALPHNGMHRSNSHHEAAAALKHMSSSMGSKPELNPMVPDLEDGRPRYYGGSSTLLSFNEMDSRPPSPIAPHRRFDGHNSGGSHHPFDAANEDPQSTARYGHASQLPHQQHPPHLPHHLQHDYTQPPHNHLRNAYQRPPPSNPAKANFAVLPPPMPQYPRNSVGWVRELRRKTLVAVGRDEVFAHEGWFKKFPLPAVDLLGELLDYYFRRLHPLLPVLHEDSLRRDLGSGRAERDSAFRGLIFAVLTIASRFFRHDPRVQAEPGDPESAGDQWAAASRFHHQVYAASLINVQVLLLSSAFMPSSLGIGTSWTVFGVAIRALQDIGLHTEKAYVGYTPFEQERRRRTFWAAFCLDTLLSINMGRPLAIRTTDSSVQYPLLATEHALTEAERSGGAVQELAPGDPTPCVAGGMIHLIKICHLTRDVISTLYQPGTLAMQNPTPSYKDMTIFSKRLDEWIVDMPIYVRHISTSPFPVQATFLHAGQNNVRLYILKPFMYDFRAALHGTPPNGGGTLPTNVPATASADDGSILRKMLLPQCANYARGTLSALQVLHEDVGVPSLYFLLHQSFLSASTFLLTVWHGTKNAEMLRTDCRIIEFSLKMYNLESKYASVLLQRAHRILRSVALRCLSVSTDVEQKARLQDVLRSSSGTSGGIAPAFLRASSVSGSGTGGLNSSNSNLRAGQRPTHASPSAPSTHASYPSVWPSSDASMSGAAHSPMMTAVSPTLGHFDNRGRPSLSHHTSGGSPSQQVACASPSGRRVYGRHGNHDWHNLQQQGGRFAGAYHHNPQHATSSSLTSSANAFALAADDDAERGTANKHDSPRYMGEGVDFGVPYGSSLDALDLQQWLPLSDSPSAGHRATQDDVPDALTSGFSFSGDHAWTEYFSRFLGELPNPSMTQDNNAGPGVGDGSQPPTSITAGLTPDSRGDAA